MVDLAAIDNWKLTDAINRAGVLELAAAIRSPHCTDRRRRRLEAALARRSEQHLTHDRQRVREEPSLFAAVMAGASEESSEVSG